MNTMTRARCRLHPNDDIKVSYEPATPFAMPFYVCGCTHEECWQYGFTRELAEYRWNESQADWEWLTRFLVWLAKRKWVKYFCIHACDTNNPYLSRFDLARWRGFVLRLHYFHRSDEDPEMHDHPWSFISLILVRGYIEETAKGYRRKYPGMILWRPASWAHRVILPKGRQSLSLVLTFPGRREWGFYTKDGWMHWKKFLKAKGCNDE